MWRYINKLLLFIIITANYSNYVPSFKLMTSQDLQGQWLLMDAFRQYDSYGLKPKIPIKIKQNLQTRGLAYQLLFEM